MRKHMLAMLLDLCLKQAAEDRDRVHLSGSYSVDEKRAVANVWTKLKEAQMWMSEADRLYKDS